MAFHVNDALNHFLFFLAERKDILSTCLTQKLLYPNVLYVLFLLIESKSLNEFAVLKQLKMRVVSAL